MELQWSRQCARSQLYKTVVSRKNVKVHLSFRDLIFRSTACKQGQGLDRQEVAVRLRTSSSKNRSVNRNSSKKNEKTQCEGTLIGAIALITGTSIGAGILAVPAKTIATGFIPSASVMAISWIFLVLEAFLLVEVNLALKNRQEINSSSLSKVLSLQTMAENTLGNQGGILVGAVYVLLTYTLIVAYIAKTGEVLSIVFHLPRSLAEALFTSAFGYLLLSGGTKLVDQANQIMTVGLIGLFLLLVVGGSSHGDWAALLHQNWTVAPDSIPVIFLALVYHDLIPVICTYLDGDARRIRTSVIIGSAIPLVMLLCWNAVALSLAPASGNRDPLDLLIQTSFIVQLFSLLAVLTSIIGSALGMSEFYIERLGRSTSTSLSSPFYLFDSASSSLPLIKLASIALVLVPPLLLSLSMSDAFFTASDLAGGYGMTTLYGVLPPVMAWGLLGKESSQLNETSKYRGRKSWVTQRGTLAVTGVCACGIIAGQLILNLS